MSDKAIIRMEGLAKIYQLGEVQVQALRGVDLEIEAGSYVAIMGPSGSGKSTMLNLLGCLDQPTAGSYYLGGENVATMNDEELSIVRGNRLGFVFQSYNLIHQLTVIENIHVPLFYQGRDLLTCEEHCARLARLVGLGERLDHRPKQLSGGQQQRVAIARSLANDPLMILADEPTGNLDSKTGLEILKLLDELNAAGKTIVLVTHDENVAMRAHRVLHMKDGVIDREVTNRPVPARTKAVRSSAAAEGKSKSDSLSYPKHNLQVLSIIRVVQLGVKSLLLHKMRSVLTMLGIIFGVCSVIAMLAIGEGASYEAQQAIKKLGSNNIILRSVKPPDDNKASSSGRSFAVEYGLTYKDAASIQTTVAGVKRVLPMRIIRDNVRFNENNVPSQIIGTHPLYPEITGMEVVRGRFLSETDETHMENVCALTVSLAEQLFPYQDPLTEEVKVGADYYQVVGLVREKSTEHKRPQSGNPNEGQALDNNLYIPLSTARSRFGETLIRRSAGSFEAERVQLHQITVELESTETVETATLQIEAIFRRFHDKKDYEMIVPLQLLRQAAQTKRMFNIVLGSIAAISLLVGGIGIMNIMLATVTERTREIGVRRALGARKKDIITQFLVETLVLSIGGGLIGVALGVITPLIVSKLTAMKTVITISSLLLAFGISGAVGVIFGLYPASRAADLHPIEALRHE
jgi:ABC-type lipoprotein export system ATPase subunit/ABC-type antimicrobial peptide transport system permease subunit